MQSYPQLITPQPIKPWMAFGSFLTIPNGGLLTSKPTRTWSLSLPHLTQTCLWFIWFWSFLLLLVLYDDDLNYIYKLYIYIYHDCYSYYHRYHGVLHCGVLSVLSLPPMGVRILFHPTFRTCYTLQSQRMAPRRGWQWHYLYTLW